MNGALSPDGTVAAIGTHDGVFVLELDTDRNYPRLIDGVGAVSALRFSGDNQTLFAGDYRGRVCCWSLANERLVWVSE